MTINNITLCGVNFLGVDRVLNFCVVVESNVL
jgi:hypothetical protein